MSQLYFQLCCTKNKIREAQQSGVEYMGHGCRLGRLNSEKTMGLESLKQLRQGGATVKKRALCL